MRNAYMVCVAQTDSWQLHHLPGNKIADTRGLSLAEYKLTFDRRAVYYFTNEQAAKEAATQLDKSGKHKGPNYYARQRYNKALPKATISNYDSPPSWIGPRFGGYRWGCYSYTQQLSYGETKAITRWDYVPEYGTITSALDAISTEPIAISDSVYAKLREYKTANGTGLQQWCGPAHSYALDYENFARAVTVETYLDDTNFPACRLSERPGTPIELEWGMRWEDRGSERICKLADDCTLTIRKADNKFAMSSNYVGFYVPRKTKRTVKALKAYALDWFLAHQLKNINSEAAKIWGEWKNSLTANTTIC